MFIDNELLFANNFAPTSTGANMSPNVLDVSPLAGIGTGGSNVSGGRDIGSGEGLYLEVLVQQTVTSGGSATVDFQFQTSASASMTSPTTVVSSSPTAIASLVAGYVFRVRLPPATYGRYVGVNFQIGTAALTAGQFQAKIVKDTQMKKNYASGFGLDS